jgi:ribonuclease P protein component
MPDTRSLRAGMTDFEDNASEHCKRPALAGRLRKRAEFMALRKGERYFGENFILQSRRRQPDELYQAQPRFGFTATRKAGSAVERNRMRRRLKEAVRLCHADLAQMDRDYVLIARRPALSAKFSILCAELKRGLARTAQTGASKHSKKRPDHHRQDQA